MALMADLDFMGYTRVILKSDQEPSIDALCDVVKNGWHGEIVPAASHGEVERAVQSVQDPLRIPGATIRNHVGVSKSAVGWSSIVPIFSHTSTRVSRTTVTQPTVLES